MPSSCSEPSPSDLARPDRAGVYRPGIDRGRYALLCGALLLQVAPLAAQGLPSESVAPDVQNAPPVPHGQAPETASPPAANASENQNANPSPSQHLSEEIQKTLHDTLPDLEVNDAQVEVLKGSTDLKTLAASLTATSNWRFFVQAAPDHERILLSVAAVPPGGNVLTFRSEHTATDQVQVRAIALARDLVQAHAAKAVAGPGKTSFPCAPEERARSSGRAVLVLNTALIGAYAGYSIQRAGGSDDPRLTYPLLALGTGIGIGAGMVVAEEWDVSYADAWYLSAGAIWPTWSALMLAQGYETSPEDARFMVGLGGTLSGLSLATLVLSTGHVSEGSAALAHSGGAVGVFLGGLAEMTLEGRTGFVPERGMGFGAAAGVVFAGAAGPLGLELTSSQVLMVDLGAGLGSLVAAAAASPLVALGGASEDRHRLWLSSIAAGTVVGALVGYSLTRNTKESGRLPRTLPFVSFMPAEHHLGSASLHVGLQGQW